MPITRPRGALSCCSKRGVPSWNSLSFLVSSCVRKGPDVPVVDRAAEKSSAACDHSVDGAGTRSQSSVERCDLRDWPPRREGCGHPDLYSDPAAHVAAAAVSIGSRGNILNRALEAGRESASIGAIAPTTNQSGPSASPSARLAHQLVSAAGSLPGIQTAFSTAVLFGRDAGFPVPPPWAPRAMSSGRAGALVPTRGDLEQLRASAADSPRLR